MFLIYLDGSGTSELHDTTHRHYVLLGVALHEGSWSVVERRVRELRKRYELPGVPLELHALEICSTISEQSKIAGFEAMDWPSRRAAVLALREQRRVQPKTEASPPRRARHHQSTSCLHLSRPERSRLFEEILDLIGASPELRLFAEIVNKQHLFKQTGKRNAMGPAFEQVVSRFDAMLRTFDRADSTRVNRGLLVADVDQHSDLMRDLTALYRDHGHSWGKLEYVIDTPFFVDSKSVSGIQLADIAAYAVRRYIDHGLDENSHEERNFMRIFHRFDRARERLHGLRHYAAAGTCACAICRERGRATAVLDPEPMM